MNKNPRLAQRLRYAFDNSLSRGPAALIVWLALATAALIALAIVVDLVIGGTGPGLDPRQVMWSFVFQALVPNPPNSLSSPWQFLVVMLAVTVASLAIVSILIGLMSATIQERVVALRRGRSPIIERDHTLILGWSEQVFDIVSWLVIANRHQRRATIAILGDRDKLEMEDELRTRITRPGRTRIVVRRGSSIHHADLDLVSPQTASAIVILPSEDTQQPDAATLKTILALTKAPDRRLEPYHVVAVLRRERNIDLVRLIGGDEVDVVLSADVIARIMAQTCRQAGLSVVYGELLDAENNEVYFQPEPMLINKTFGEALFAYEDSAVIGIFTHAGIPLLNPPRETVLESGDQIIALSDRPDTVRLSGVGERALQSEAIRTGSRSPSGPERTLILGWNWRARAIITYLDAYIAPRSHIMVIAQHETVASDINALRQEVHHHVIEFQDGEITSQAVLKDALLQSYDHVMVLCYSDTLEIQYADAITLLTLFHIRAIADEQGYAFTLTSEMMDARNSDLAESTRADDFILSDRLIGQMMIQIARNRAMNLVFKELLDPAGASIYLRPAGDYIVLGEPVSFYTVVEAAQQRGEVAIGYRRQAAILGVDGAHGVVVNPAKSVPVTFSSGDHIIVVAQD